MKKKKSEDNLMENHNFRHIHNTFLIMIHTNKWRTPFPIFIKLSLFFVLGKCNSVLLNSTIRNDKQNWLIRPGLVCNKICSILSHFFLDFLLRSKYCQYFIILDQYHENLMNFHPFIRDLHIYFSPDIWTLLEKIWTNIDRILVKII